MRPSESPGWNTRESETGHCSEDTVNLEIPNKYLSFSAFVYWEIPAALKSDA